MLFNTHLDVADKHAFLSPSNYHWLNYNEQKLEARYISSRAAKRGTDLHELAHEAIRLGVKLPRNKETINMYVNDGINYKMSCEVCFFYSRNSFGHADCASFRRNKLRIHDLKNGITRASEHQLEVYAALFCLEYEFSPFDIAIELRIYQNDEVRIYEPFGDTIAHIMDKIVTFDRQIEEMREEDAW